MLWPGERIIRRISRRGRHDQVLLRLHRIGPTEVYADLLAYALSRNFSTGWAYYAFLEIFGTKPRGAGLQQRNIKPKNSPSGLIIEWATTCKRPKPTKKEKHHEIQSRSPDHQIGQREPNI